MVTWKLDVAAKVKKLELRMRIKATNARPSFRCPSLVINLKFKPKTLIWWRRSTRRPKILFFSFNSLNMKKHILLKFRIRFPNHTTTASFNITALTIKGWDCGVSAAAAALVEDVDVLWKKWVSEKPHRSPIILFVYLASVFKNLGPRKLSSIFSILMLLLIVATFNYSVLLPDLKQAGPRRGRLSYFYN